MKNNTILQITAYLALARSAGKAPNTIGVILPFQQTTLEYSLQFTEYNHQPFLNLLLELARPRICSMQEQIELAMFTPIIGAHTIKVKGSVYQSLLAFYSARPTSQPCQIFMRGNRGAKSVVLKDADIAQSLQFIEQHNVKYYVHAPYTINLCHPCGNKTKVDNDAWAIRILREDLRHANVTGGRGVVVHTGKGLHLSEPEAYDAMYAGVLECLQDASEECPLLIETPVDKGSELCGTPQSFADFYLRFTAEQRRVLKICVDTCHVFAAGYDPHEYLVTFSALVGVESIALIHLNDAQWMKGSAHDGHEWVGNGCIGLTRMLKAIKWCAERNIPMVHE